MTGAKVIAPLVLGVLMLALWEGVVRAADIPPYILPGPFAVAQALVADWGTLEPSLLVTLRITLEALAAAVVVGGLLAILFSLSRWIELSLFPYAIILQVTPIVAIAPLIIIWANNVELSLLICAWLVAFFPILSNTILGLRSVDSNLLDLFRLYGAGRLALFPGGLAHLGRTGADRRGGGGVRCRNRRQCVGAGLAHPRVGLPAQDPTHVRCAGPDLGKRHCDLPAAFAAQPLGSAALARKRAYARGLTAHLRVARNSLTGPCQMATPLSLLPRLWPSLLKAPCGRNVPLPPAAL
jgi:Binding-protein-dependent transport system inner membrane component